MSPKFIVEARSNSFVVVGVLEATKNLIVDLKLLPLLPRLSRRRRVVRSTATALAVVLRHHLPQTRRNLKCRRSKGKKWREEREKAEEEEKIVGRLLLRETTSSVYMVNADLRVRVE